MELVRTYDYKALPAKYTIAEAVEHACDGSDYDRGALETAAATARRTLEFTGAFIQLLHDKRLLTDVDVLTLLSGFKAAP